MQQLLFKPLGMKFYHRPESLSLKITKGFYQCNNYYLNDWTRSAAADHKSDSLANDPTNLKQNLLGMKFYHRPESLSLKDETTCSTQLATRNLSSEA